MIYIYIEGREFCAAFGIGCNNLRGSKFDRRKYLFPPSNIVPWSKLNKKPKLFLNRVFLIIALEFRNFKNKAKLLLIIIVIKNILNKDFCSMKKLECSTISKFLVGISYVLKSSQSHHMKFAI